MMKIKFSGKGIAKIICEIFITFAIIKFIFINNLNKYFI